jgi:hypothetical protein
MVKLLFDGILLSTQVREANRFSCGLRMENGELIMLVFNHSLLSFQSFSLLSE